MKGTIYLVPFGKQKATEFLLQQAIHGISGNDFSNILYIGPTPRKIRDAQITFANLIPADGFIPPKFFTIKQFTNELFLKYCQDYKKLSDYLKPLLIQKISPDISIGYAKLIAEFIRETKQYLTDYTDTDLEEIILKELINKGCPADGDIYRRIQNALSIRAQYNQLLKTKKWLDAEDVGLQSLEFINNVEVKILVLDGFFYDLTKLEEKIVTALINRAEKVYALSFYDERIPEAYALPQEFLVFLRKLNLFQEEKISEHVDIRSALPYYVCPSIEDEVEFIASRIKYEYCHKDLSLNRTLVTFSRLDAYETTVRRIFDKYQIPYSLDTTKYLSKTQPVIAVLTLLRAIVNDFPRLETVAVLSSKFFNRFSQETKDVINYFSKKAGIIKTANQWKDFGATLKAILKEENKLTPALTKKINRAQQELNTLLVLSERFPKQTATLSEFTQSLRQLLAQFQWCQGEFNDEITTIKNEFYNVLAIIENFELDFGKTLIPLQDYLKILEYFLDQTEISPETKTEGVTILGFLETRGLDCDYLFFGGLSEDKFPGQGHFDPILPEWLRQKLQLPSLERHLMRMRFHYFRLVNTARLRTVLSFYNTDQDQVFLPSPYLSGEAQPLIKYNAIFSQEQLQREIGEQKQIDVTAFITPVDFSNDPAIKKILSKHFGPTKRISVTTLDKYARCPYQFYLENVIEVEDLDEPEYQIEPTLWGNIAHAVFERLYQTGPVPIEEIAPQINNILNAVLKESKL
ncbi:MAG: PD-(D/E)XK nuclease family protein, partial [candidate division WOR-3 bacterium]